MTEKDKEIQHLRRIVIKIEKALINKAVQQTKRLRTVIRPCCGRNTSV